MSGWPKSKDKTSVKRNRFERKIVFQQLFFRGNVGFRGCMFRVKTILPLTNVQLCSSISSGLGIFQRYVSSIDTYTVHFSSCHDLGRTIVFNILHYIKTIKSTHKTSLFFWVFTEKPCDFLVKPTIFATHHPPDPKKKHHKKKKKTTENPFFHQNWKRHLFGLGPVHGGYIAEWNAENGRFLVALKFLKVLTVDLAVNALGGRGLVGKIQGLKCQKMCKWWEVCVWIQMKPLEKVSRNHQGNLFKFSQSHDFLRSISRNKHFQPTNTPRKPQKCYWSRKRDGPMSFQSVHLSQKHMLCTNQQAVNDAWWRTGRFFLI